MMRKRVLAALAAAACAGFVVGGYLASSHHRPRPPGPEAPSPGSPVSETMPPPPSLLVDDFEVGQTQGMFAERKNRLDAFQGTWARRPSYTIITKVPDSRPGRQGRTLRLEYAKVGGWCGWYTLLNQSDITPFNALTFWVKGEQGGERFDIGLADARMQALEIDAVYVGSIKAFLPQGVTDEWQLVKVPLASLRSELDLTRMGSLVFWFRYEGRGAIQVDDVQFVQDPEVTRLQEYNRPRAAKDRAAPRALWLWKLDPVTALQVRDDLFAFCEQTGVTRLYLYLGETPVTDASPVYQDQLGAFLIAAHRRGIAVDALTGNPLWAKPAHHRVLLDWIQGFLEFNARRPAQARMDGVHLDVEPYLLAEWEQDKGLLKQQYVELLQRCRQTLAAARQPGFQLGVAIPLFYDREGEFERQILGAVDYVALMDYFDSAVDITEKATPHIALAAQQGKPVIVGVETQDLVQLGQGKRRNTFHEEGWEDMEQQLDRVKRALRGQAGFGGVAIHAYESYRLLQRGRNVPTRERPAAPYRIPATRRTQELLLDGRLDEWQGLPPTVVNTKGLVVYGAGAWRGPDDLSVAFWGQWDEEALYVAAEVRDDVVYQERRKGEMWEGDHVELWLDMDLYGDYNEAMNSSDDFQVGLSPGNFQGLPPEAFIWVPSVAPGSERRIVIGAQRTAHGYTLEARLPAELLLQTMDRRVGVEPIQPAMVQQAAVNRANGLQQTVLKDHRLRAGFTLGIMVDTSDTDHPNQPQKCLISTSADRTWGDPTTFGILELQ